MLFPNSRRQLIALALWACSLIVVCWHAPATWAQNTKPGGTDITQGQPTMIQVMGIVNGEQITRHQIGMSCLNRYGQKVLEGIINRQLIIDECKRQNVVITIQDVDDEIKRRAEAFNMTPNRYIELLKSERDISPERLRNEIIWMELALRRLAAQNLQISQEELQQAFESEYGPKVQVRAIVLESREKAEQILAAAQANPAEFETLAKDHSVDPNSAAFRGMLPPIRRHSGEPEFENVAFALQPNEISRIIDIADPTNPQVHQYVILKCERHYPGAEITPDQQPQIVQRLQDEIAEAKLAEASGELFRRLQDQSQIVNVHNDPQLSQQMPGVAATLNGAKITMSFLSEECITRYGTEVLESEINRTLIKQALQRQNKTVTDADIEGEIARAAESYGFADINQWIQYVTKNDSSQVDVYIQDEVWPSIAMKKLVEDRVEVTPDDLQKGFEANFGERVDVLAIVQTDYNLAKKVWKMATDNPDRTYFGELASQYSVEPASKANRGEVPPVQRHGGRPTLEDEAFRLRTNEISGLVNVGDYWIIMYCLGRTTPKVQDFDAVQDELHADILEKKLRLAMDQLFAELRESAQIDNFLAGTSQTPRQANAPGAVPQR